MNGPDVAALEDPSAPHEPTPSTPDQLWVGSWTPAPGQPTDDRGRYRPVPVTPPNGDA